MSNLENHIESFKIDKYTYDNFVGKSAILESSNAISWLLWYSESFKVDATILTGRFCDDAVFKILREFDPGPNVMSRISFPFFSI